MGELYAEIASNLEESSWASIFSQLDADTFSKLQSALDSLKEVADTEEQKLSEDPTAALSQLNAKMNKILKGLKAHRGRFTRMEHRLASIENASNNDAPLSFESPSVVDTAYKMK